MNILNPDTLTMNHEPRFRLSLRESQRYNDGWSHLDDWSEIATARRISTRTVTNKSDGEYNVAHSLLSIKAEPSATRETIEQALRDTLRTGCRCEHDCCGHYQTCVTRVRRVPHTSLYFVRLSSYRNI